MGGSIDSFWRRAFQFRILTNFLPFLPARLLYIRCTKDRWALLASGPENPFGRKFVNKGRRSFSALKPFFTARIIIKGTFAPCNWRVWSIASVQRPTYFEGGLGKWILYLYKKKSTLLVKWHKMPDSVLDGILLWLNAYGYHKYKDGYKLQ